MALKLIRVKVKSGLALTVMFMLVGCGGGEFTSFGSPEAHYAIHHKNGFLLRALNTDGEGVPKLQLFTTDGDLLEEQSMHNEPFRIDRWTADTITVKYMVADLRLFQPWFRDNIRRSPSKLGSFTLRYSYEKTAGSHALTAYAIDSLAFQKDRYRVDVFNQGISIASIPLDSLLIYPEQLIHSKKTKNGMRTGSRYVIGKDAGRQLLKAIISGQD